MEIKNLPSYMKVKWSKVPTSFDQTGVLGNYIQEITVKKWYVPILLWKRSRFVNIEVIIRKPFKKKFNLHHFFVWILVLFKWKRGDYIIGG